MLKVRRHHASKSRLLACVSGLAIGLALIAAGQSLQSPNALGTIAAPDGILIGAAADPKYFSEPEYSAILGSEFTQLQGENQMKFSLIHPRPDTDPNPYDFSAGDALVDFAQHHHMKVRGHTLVWHNQVSKWVSAGNFSSAQLADLLQRHIATVMSHYAGKIYAWDVVNEAFEDNGSLRHTVWYDKPGIAPAEGTEYLAQAMQWAHSADPNAKLFYNDYDAEVLNKKSDAIYAMASDFKKRGVPLDGIGFQTHITLKFDDPATLASYAKNLERFAKLGLKVQMTEVDVRLPDNSAASLAAQAKLYGEIAALCVQQPACNAFQTWGLTDKHSWIPEFYKGQGWALLWDGQYQKKPAYEAVGRALAKQ